MAAFAGIVGPILFSLIVFGLGSLQADYHPWVESISAISLYPGGWLQDVNFVMFGILTGVFTIALYRGVRPGPASLTGLAASMLSALGIVLMGIFPMTMDKVGGDVVSVHSDGHAIASLGDTCSMKCSE